MPASAAALCRVLGTKIRQVGYLGGRSDSEDNSQRWTGAVKPESAFCDTCHRYPYLSRSIALSNGCFENGLFKNNVSTVYGLQRVDLGPPHRFSQALPRSPRCEGSEWTGILSRNRRFVNLLSVKIPIVDKREFTIENSIVLPGPGPPNRETVTISPGGNAAKFYMLTEKFARRLILRCGQKGLDEDYAEFLLGMNE